MDLLVYYFFLHVMTAPGGEANKGPSLAGHGRWMEKAILDDILGSRAYDPRIRPAGAQSNTKLESIFCHRHLPTWSWKQCESTKSNKTNFSKISLATLPSILISLII